MSVLVRFGGRKAILRLGEWRSADPRLESSLNAALAHWLQESGGPSLSDPDQEQAIAREMARRFGGRLLLHLEARSRTARRAYVEFRQLRLNF